MKSICLIAARKQSKGVKKKNIRLFSGKPLISHAIQSSLKSKNFETVIVSTEDQEIAKIAKSAGAEVPFIRPKHLAKDSTPMKDVLVHCINEIH